MKSPYQVGDVVSTYADVASWVVVDASSSLDHDQVWIKFAPVPKFVIGWYRKNDSKVVLYFDASPEDGQATYDGKSFEEAWTRVIMMNAED